MIEKKVIKEGASVLIKYEDKIKEVNKKDDKKLVDNNRNNKIASKII